MDKLKGKTLQGLGFIKAVSTRLLSSKLNLVRRHEVWFLERMRPGQRSKPDRVFDLAACRAELQEKGIRTLPRVNSVVKVRPEICAGQDCSSTVIGRERVSSRRKHSPKTTNISPCRTSGFPVFLTILLAGVPPIRSTVNFYAVTLDTLASSVSASRVAKDVPGLLIYRYASSKQCSRRSCFLPGSVET